MIYPISYIFLSNREGIILIWLPTIFIFPTVFLMNNLEREMLHRIITDRPFAEYITQRIDIGDFDDEVANRIYDGIVDLLYQGRQVSFKVLLEYFGNENFINSRSGILGLEGLIRSHKLSE